ncbi:MAG: inositol monophosphatase family protein [Anaerolineales bacterium]
MNYAAYLEFVTEVAYRAGQISLGYFRRGVVAEYKEDNTPVTEADRAVEQFLRREIERAYPDHAIVGEEFGEQAGSDGRPAWIIDPIDGTKSFMRGVPLYAVLIGLEIDGEVRVGAAYYPGTDELLYAAEGMGAWCNGRRVRVSPIGELSRACVSYTTYHNFQKKRSQAVWERLSQAAYMLRGWSDAYGLLLVATGRTEAHLEPIMAVWDCGPFPVIFKEAGGYFGDWRGTPGHRHGEALACNAALLPQLLEILNTE